MKFSNKKKWCSKKLVEIFGFYCRRKSGLNFSYRYSSHFRSFSFFVLEFSPIFISFLGKFKLENCWNISHFLFCCCHFFVCFWATQMHVLSAWKMYTGKWMNEWVEMCRSAASKTLPDQTPLNGMNAKNEHSQTLNDLTRGVYRGKCIRNTKHFIHTRNRRQKII